MTALLSQEHWVWINPLLLSQVKLALAAPQGMHGMFSFSISALRYTLAAFEDCKNNQ